MSGMFLGRTTLALLIPAVIFFGLFMFGTGFLTGSFYRARTTPVETVIRRTSGAGSTLQQLQNLEESQSQAPAVEAESLAQATGQLESAPAAPEDIQEPQTTPPQTPAETAEQTPPAVSPPEAPTQAPQEVDDGARERALAELRESQLQEQPPSAPEFQEFQASQESQPQPDGRMPAPAPEQVQAQEQPAPQPDSVNAVDTQPYSFQVGAFQVQRNAQELAATLAGRGYDAWVVSDKDNEGRMWHFVRVGRYQGRQEATSAAAAFRQREGVNAVPVPLNQGQEAAAPVQEATPARPLYVVHAGAYSNAGAARNGARPLFDYGYVPCVLAFQDEQHQTWHLVELAQFSTRQEAEAFLAQAPQQREGLNLRLRMINADNVTSKHCF